MNMSDKALCPLCGQGHVTAHVEPVESEYKGIKAMLPLH
jgi:HTH-type transcriptional regulator / antitoxin MqsA